MSTVTVSVPATTANIGPGFDCIGAAVTLYNQFHFSTQDESETDLSIIVTGTEAHRVSCDGTNLLYQAFAHLYQHLGKKPLELLLRLN